MAPVAPVAPVPPVAAVAPVAPVAPARRPGRTWLAQVRLQHPALLLDAPGDLDVDVLRRQVTLGGGEVVAQTLVDQADAGDEVAEQLDLFAHRLRERRQLGLGGRRFDRPAGDAAERRR